MGERAKIMLNEYTAKTLLKRDDLDLDKFYSTDIKMMVKVAQQELKKKDNIINELEKELNKKIEAIKTIKDMLGEEAKIVNPHIEVLETEYKYFLDKLKELKENNK